MTIKPTKKCCVKKRGCRGGYPIAFSVSTNSHVFQWTWWGAVLCPVWNENVINSNSCPWEQSHYLGSLPSERKIIWTQTIIRKVIISALREKPEQYYRCSGAGSKK